MSPHTTLLAHSTSYTSSQHFSRSFQHQQQQHHPSPLHHRPLSPSHTTTVVVKEAVNAVRDMSGAVSAWIGIGKRTKVMIERERRAEKMFHFLSCLHSFFILAVGSMVVLSEVPTYQFWRWTDWLTSPTSFFAKIFFYCDLYFLLTSHLDGIRSES